MTINHSGTGQNWLLSRLAESQLAFTDCMPNEVKYFVEHSDSKFVIAHDQEQVDKFLTPYKDSEGKEHPPLKDELPLLKKVIYWDPKGVWNYDDPILMSFNKVIEMGEEYDKLHPDLFEANIGLPNRDWVLLAN